MPSVTLIRYFYPNIYGWPRSLVSHEVNSTRISSHIEDNGCQHIGVTTSNCLGHVTLRVTWPFDSPGAISYRCSIVTESLSLTIFKIICIFHIWVTTLTFLGHVTSSVTWPIDPSHVISYWCPIVTKPLSLTVFKILGPQIKQFSGRKREHTVEIFWRTGQHK